MVTLLEWFGEEPIYYYLIAFEALLAFLFLAARPDSRPNETRSEIAFLLATGLTLFAFRRRSSSCHFNWAHTKQRLWLTPSKLRRTLRHGGTLMQGRAARLTAYIEEALHGPISSIILSAGPYELLRVDSAP
jgi:hypothetical protein